MEWYLVYTEKDKSLSIIDASAIVSAGDRSQMKFLKVHDHVTFVYAGASYMGVILGMSDSRVEIDELAKAEKIRMKQGKKENVDSSVSAINQKRRSQPPVKYGESGFDGPPASKKVNNSRSNRRTLPEDESTRKRILELNKARADKAMSHSIIKSVNNKSAEDDPSYKPDSDDASDGSSSSEMCDFVQDSIRRKEERVQLLKSAKNSAGSSKAESASTASASPTKEELRRQLEEYKLKLQAAYDRDDSDHKLTPTNDIENFFDAEDKKLADEIEKIREVNFSTEYKKDSGRFKSGKINEKEKQTLSDREKGKKIKKPEVKKQEDSDQEEDNDKSCKINEKDKQTLSDREKGKKIKKPEVEKQEDSDQEEDNNEDVKKANQGKKHEQSDEDDDNDDVRTGKSPNVKKSKLESKKSGESSELDDADTYEYLSYQLYGNQKDTIHLMNGIYCDARELTSAIQASREMTHMVRRLMVGVFKVEEILNCTFTGRRPTAAGADQVIGKKIDPLHPGAILAILKYSKVTAKSRKWPILRKKDLHTVITQKLGEMKRTYRKQNAKPAD